VEYADDLTSRATGARRTRRAARPRAPTGAAERGDARIGERRPREAVTHSYSKDHAQLLRRLARMEGQVRGISRMIEREEYCIDILQQTSALRAAVDAVSLLVMEDHVAGCLATGGPDG
jgi:DNA-binding FrmR family transcriptional regulator